MGRGGGGVGGMGRELGCSAAGAGGAEVWVLAMGPNKPLCPSRLLALDTQHSEVIRGSPEAPALIRAEVYTYLWKQ